MRITVELLEKYLRGLCSPEEKAAVEQWLTSSEDEVSELSAEAISEMKQNVRRSLPPFLDNNKPLVVPLYMQVIRYAAAACIIIGVFVAGRLSVSTSYAKPLVDAELKDRL